MLFCSGRLCFFFFQAEDGIRDLVRSRGLGDVYKRQGQGGAMGALGDLVGIELCGAGVDEGLQSSLGADLSLIHI